MRVRRYAVGLGLLLACAVACKGKDKGKGNHDGERVPATEPPPPAERAQLPADAGADRAVWRTRVEAVPGQAVLTWVNGPRRFDDEIWVGSSVIGVAALDPETGRLLSQEREAGPFLKRSDDPDTLRSMKIGGETLLVTRTGLERVGAWRHDFADSVALGVAGPIVMSDSVVAVVDEILVGVRWRDGVQTWRSEGRFSHVERSLAAGAGSVLRAVAIDDGVGPTVIDPATGGRVRAGDRVPGLLALAAAWLPGGELAVVVRRDATMRDDVLAVFDARGGLAWQWSLPRPDEPRVDPIGLVGDGDGFVLFYDGRYCARFPRPSGP